MSGIFEQVQEKLASYDIKWSNLQETSLDAELSKELLLDVVASLKNMSVFYLVAITGLDEKLQNNQLEVLYHFCARADVVTLRVKTNRTLPELDSICSLYPYASPLERETGEMFGITFTNTPDTSRLFLPDDWDEGIYPLRKDANLGEVDDAKSE
jgi:Ni,Fe-hydrogenase III component G